MSTNFDFLKNTDKNLFELITDAEKLYRDEYFEQCIGQTRRFAESVCKSVLGEKYCAVQQSSFDEMLATLKDKSKNSAQEKEFLDDLYFLKQQGNRSLHSSKVKQDGIVALECLQRAFEVALNYCVFTRGEKTSLLKLHYDIELLVTGKKNKSLAERYKQKKTEINLEKPVKRVSFNSKINSNKKTDSKAKTKKTTTAQKTTPRKRKSSSKNHTSNSFFKFFVTSAVLFSLLVIAAIWVISIL